MRECDNDGEVEKVFRSKVRVNDQCSSLLCVEMLEYQEEETPHGYLEL